MGVSSQSTGNCGEGIVGIDFFLTKLGLANFEEKIMAAGDVMGLTDGGAKLLNGLYDGFYEFLAVNSVEIFGYLRIVLTVIRSF